MRYETLAQKIGDMKDRAIGYARNLYLREEDKDYRPNNMGKMATTAALILYTLTSTANIGCSKKITNPDQEQETKKKGIVRLVEDVQRFAADDDSIKNDITFKVQTKDGCWFWYKVMEGDSAIYQDSTNLSKDTSDITVKNIPEGPGYILNGRSESEFNSRPFAISDARPSANQDDLYDGSSSETNTQSGDSPREDNQDPTPPDSSGTPSDSSDVPPTEPAPPDTGDVPPEEPAPPDTNKTPDPDPNDDDQDKNW